jgi:hypothetical protein
MYPDYRDLPDHSYDEFLRSAENGCQFCSLVCQASCLLRSAGSMSRLRIRLYKNYPTEIYSLSLPSDYDVVEVYANSSKFETRFIV